MFIQSYLISSFHIESCLSIVLYSPDQSNHNINQSKQRKISSWETNENSGLFHILNPLTPKSDQHLISPYNITPESNIKVMRVKQMITN